MKRYTIILSSICSLLIMQGCSKETKPDSYEFFNVFVFSKPYVNTPEVEVYANGELIGNLKPNYDVSARLPLSKAPVTLTVKEPTTGEQLLDSTFMPGQENKFTILISTDLGISQFYTPRQVEPRPVPSDSFRIQLFHKIEYQGIKRTVTFKVFEDLSGSASSVDMYELPMQITVPYGKVSEDLNIPYQLKANGRPKKYRMKAYDATTGEILVDILPPYPPQLTGIGAGSFNLVYMRTAPDDAMPAGMRWNTSSSDFYEPLQ